ncbi:MAG: hypothetical protein M3O30_03420 [Planctomycetota bacterium]|nr:hypothetical protein [Planctomycetota bacterium]
MLKKLGDDDRRAIDLLLDREPGDSMTKEFVMPGEVTPKRLASIERILSLLQAMPSVEPPADLISKTMHRIDSAVGSLQNAVAQSQQISSPDNA